MSIPFTAPFSLLYHHLSNLSPDAIQCFINEKPAIKVSHFTTIDNVCGLSHGNILLANVGKLLHWKNLIILQISLKVNANTEVSPE